MFPAHHVCSFLDIYYIPTVVSHDRAILKPPENIIESVFYHLVKNDIGKMVDIHKFIIYFRLQDIAHARSSVINKYVCIFLHVNLLCSVMHQTLYVFYSIQLCIYSNLKFLSTNGCNSTSLNGNDLNLLDPAEEPRERVQKF